MTSLKRGIRFRDLALFYVVVTFSIRWIASAAAAGPSILLVWVAALLFFFIPLAASVMELSSRLPQEGGIYLWTREAFGSFPGFLAAWCYWMSNLPFFAAVLYFGGASALYAFGPAGLKLAANPLYFIAFASLWLAVITGLNIVGVNAGKWLNNIASLGMFLPLATLFSPVGNFVWSIWIGCALPRRKLRATLVFGQRRVLVQRIFCLRRR